MVATSSGTKKAKGCVDMNLVVKCRSCGKVLGMAENIPRDQLTVQNAVGEAMLRYRCSDPAHVVNANLNFEWAEQIAKPLAWADARDASPAPANGQAAPAAPAPQEKGTTIVKRKKNGGRRGRFADRERS